MENLRPNEQRAKMAIALIWVVLAIEMISLISDYFQYALLQAAISGHGVSIETANANDTRQRVVAVIFFIVYITSAVIFIRWFRRAYFNLHAKADYLSYTEGWAAGGWFLPILNLYTPYQIMKELFQKTNDILIENGLTIKDEINTTALGWWWGLWIVNGIVGQFVFRYTLKAETIDELTISTIASMIGSLLTIPLAFITVKIVKDYSKMETLLTELKGEEELTIYNSTYLQPEA